MAKAEIMTVIENTPLTKDTYRLRLKSNQPVQVRCGQFLNLKIPGKALRRPISVTSWKDDEIELTYRVVGEGTRILTQCRDTLDVINECGNGFDLTKFDKEVLLIGGGIGTAPLIACTEEALRQGLQVKVVFGYQNRSQTLFQEFFLEKGIHAEYVYDEDGENVVTRIRDLGLEKMDFLACGPVRMMQAVDGIMEGYGQFSLETRMGCGFGACMGCSVRLKDRMARICKEGPVFEKGEIVWQNLL